MSDFAKKAPVPGSDVTLDIFADYEPVPMSDFAGLTHPGNPWLPKTDWSRDSIIATDT